MAAQLPSRNPWVDRYSTTVGIGLQAFPLPDAPDPSGQLVAVGLLAEELGLDGFFIGDHPGYAPEAWLHLTSIGAQTSRIELGSIVFCASYRHPAYLARLAADFDNLTAGRLVLGLGIGWAFEEFAQLGIEFAPVSERQRALEEYLDILTGAWGDSPVSVQGNSWSAEASRVRPLPVQRPRPPIIIAGSGEKTTLRQVAQFADGCNFGPGRNTGAVRLPADYERKFRVLREHCDDLGRAFDDILRTQFTSWLMIAETEADAAAKRDRYYPDGMNEDQRLTRVIGTPDQVVAYYRELIDAGVQYIVCQILDASDLQTVRLLATEVAPRLRSG